MKSIYSLAPVNATAARVVSSGQHYEPSKVITNLDTDLPIKTRPVTATLLKDPNFTDLTGIMFGRFTVIGLEANSNGGLWVVRCQCGRYATRRSKAIRNKNNIVDRCEHCRHLAHKKRNELWRRTGISKDACEF